MHKPSNRSVYLTALVLAVAAGACVGTSKPATFYVLRAEAEPSGRARQDPVVIVGPIALPEYLDRPQIVTRLEQGEMRIDEFARWAGPLDRNIDHVLSENIGALIGSDRVIPSLTQRVSEGYRLTAVVSRFEADASGVVLLRVTWALGPNGSVESGSVQRSDYSGASSVRDYGDRIRVMNQLLLRWSQDIAAALRAAEAAAGS